VQGYLSASAIKSHARELGFDLCGFAAAARHPKLARFAEWIAAGYAGDMAYLADSADERLDPALVLPGVRSVIAVACVYNVDRPYSVAALAPGQVAVSRYAWGDDYHDVMRDRLRELVRWLAATAGPGLEAFSSVDGGPIQDRVWAEQAGLGWIGKNTCVINEHLGSWMFLGEVFVSAEIPSDEPALDRCGSCTRCIEACPTGAIVEPYVLDSRRCLSYLTIETRAPVAADLRGALGSQVYGCDICQDVCPWNRRAAVSDDAAWQPREALFYPRLIDLCRRTDDEWRRLLRGSAMRRAGLRRIRRTLAYASSQLAGEPGHAARAALREHPSAAHPDVAEAIDWAAAANHAR
jgi:epoxyqueuosine reductase